MSKQPKGPMTLFDHLSNLCYDKRPWSELSDADRKSFSAYMINRFLSMNMDYVELINDLQKYTIGLLSEADVYQLYIDVIPKKKQFNKYIKGKKEQKYNTNLIDIISKHFLISRSEAVEYLDYYFDNRLNTLVELIKKYGISDKEIKTLTKLQ